MAYEMPAPPTYLDITNMSNEEVQNLTDEQVDQLSPQDLWDMDKLRCTLCDTVCETSEMGEQDRDNFTCYACQKASGWFTR